MAQKGVCPVTVFLLAFLGAQAAPIQLTSIEAGLRNDTSGTNADATFQARVSESFGRLPLMFEAAGSEGAGFVCRGSGHQLWLSPSEVALTLQRTRNPDGAGKMRNEPLKLRGLQFPAPASAGGVPETALLRIQLVGGDTAARAVGMEQLPTKVNYFLGNDPRQWRTDVAVFGKVRCQNVYPGIDLVYYGNQRQLEYDFVVAPGASAGQIALRFHGAEMMEIDAGGDLILQTAGGPVRQHRPVVYQEWNGRRQEISGRYVLREGGGQEVGFEIAAYDPSRPLTIDPVLVYSTFLGGLGLDRAWAIAVDTNGCAYVVGDTTSADFPEINAAHPAYHGGLSDAVVVKLGSGGTNLIYSTYLGGSGADVGFGIALDGSGNVYLTGLTASPDFPVTTDAVSTHLNSRAFFGYYTNDAFVAKLDANGANLLYSTYLGGSAADEGIAIAVDGHGDIYVAGDTFSSDFPTDSVSPSFGGARDAFVIKLTPGSANSTYSTYLGGSGDDRAQGIAVDAQGQAIISGFTSSINFPVTNAFQTNLAGGTYDAFVTKLTPDGSSRLFSTYLGGSGDDEASRIVLDGAGNAFLTGITTSTNFPTKNPLYSTNSGLEDAFIAKLDANGTNLVYSTYLGGALNDEGWSLAVDTEGNVYVVGRTSSPNFPTVSAYQPALGGLENVFVSRLNASGTALDFSTYLGGSLTDEGYGIFVDNAGNAYLTGMTASTGFPVYPPTNGVQTSFGGGAGDAFVAKLFSRNAELRASRRAGIGGSDVMIFWPYGLPNFELQSTDGLNGTNTNWLTVTNAPTVVGDDNAITYTNVNGNRLFRLRRVQ